MASCIFRDIFGVTHLWPPVFFWDIYGVTRLWPPGFLLWPPGVSGISE